MGNRGKRKKLAFGTLAAGTVLAVASAAFACTTYRGTATVENADQVGNPGSTTAVGNNSGMGYCSGSPSDGAAGPANAQVGDTVVVTTRQSSGCNTAKLAAGVDKYQVNFVNYERQFSRGKYIDVPGFAVSSTGAYTMKADCMTPNSAGVVNISGGFTFDVDSAGNGQGSYAIPATTSNPNNGGAVRPNTATDASAICISDAGAYSGNQIPLRIVL